MVYLYLGKNSIKVLGLTKTLLGQFNLAHFSKTHSSNFITDGKLQGTDLIASAIKEAITQSKPDPISNKDIVLILPQEMFTFGRFTVPKDISETALTPFIKDKVQSELKLNLEDTYHDYLVNTKDGETTVFFYALTLSDYQSLEETLKLLQLRITRIVPETISYYTLFEKTLRKDKKENIMFACYKEQNSFAYMYDSHGLLKDEKLYVEGDIKPGLKQIVDEFQKDGQKINRLILSGSQSGTVRQDLFTKDVGAWTNPLEKIIENFYKDYLKTILAQEKDGFSILQYDVCFGAFIFAEENKDFTLTKQSITSGSRMKMPKISINTGFFGEIFNLKTIIIFILSFGVSFGVMFGLSQINSGDGFNIGLPSLPQTAEPTPEPTTVPTDTPTPTPAIDREELRVKVLNGSGIAGKASEVEAILQDLGYADIVTGNADSFDYETTELQLSKEYEDALTVIQEDLADYVDISDAETIDDEDETADVILIIGTDFE